MHVLSGGFFLAVCAITAAEGEGDSSMFLKRSDDKIELHISNDDCLLKITLTTPEADTLSQMAKKKNLDGFADIKPCIDPMTDDDKKISNSYDRRSRDHVGDVSSAKYAEYANNANKGMECFNTVNADTSRIGEYVYKVNGDVKYDPSKYTGGIWGSRKRAFKSLVGLRNAENVEIPVLSTSDPKITGLVARKYCFVVGNRAVKVRKLLYKDKALIESVEKSRGALEASVSSNRYGWSGELALGIDGARSTYGDSKETIAIWKHTRTILNKNHLDSDWVINDAEHFENVGGKKYNLEWIVDTHDSVIFSGRAQGGSTTRVFKYTNNCSAKKKYLEDCTTGQSNEECQEPIANVLDPLMDEFLIMNTLGAPYLEVENYVPPVPFAYALSETFKVGTKIGYAKIKSKSVVRWGRKSCATSDGTLRGIEEDYVGIDMWTHYGRLLIFGQSQRYMVEAIAMTRRMMGLVWRFHDLGFIHGDIHKNNAAFEEKKASGWSYSALRDKMVLIDFGYAEFIPQAYGTNEELPRREDLNASLLSPWHLMGSRIGRRDDLYRVMQITAFLFSSIDFGDIFKEFDMIWNNGGVSKSERDNALGDVKLKNFFDHEVAHNVYCCTDASFNSYREPLRYLKNAMEKILKIEHPDKRPPYEEIIRELDMALLSLPSNADKRKKAALINKLKDQLRKDTTPLPNGDGPNDHGRQIVDVVITAKDPWFAIGGQNNISKRHIPK